MMESEEVCILASLIALGLREQLRLFKPLITRADIEACRVLQDRLGELGARAAASRTVVEPMPFSDFQAAAVIPADCRDASRAVLYLHGGGYTAGSLSYALGFGSVLALHLGLPVLCAAYRLAPENPFPAAVDDARAAYLSLLSAGLSPESISFIGESAGGGLLYALCLRLKAEKLPLPGRLVALSPWVDLTMSGRSYVENAKKDPCLSEDSLRDYAGLYAGRDLRNPLVSPVFGDLRGLPPSRIFAGGDELLLSDAEMMQERLTSAGCESELWIEPGLWHVYPLYGIPEANAALHAIRRFVLPGETDR